MPCNVNPHQINHNFTRRLSTFVPVRSCSFQQKQRYGNSMRCVKKARMVMVVIVNLDQRLFLNIAYLYTSRKRLLHCHSEVLSFVPVRVSAHSAKAIRYGL